MSTRCQLEFKRIGNYLNEKKPVIDRRTVYRHSDGYPEGVIPDLKEFLKWNEGRNSDIEYQTANFIYWSKRKLEENYFIPKNRKGLGLTDEERSKWSDFGSTNCSILHTGFGVCANDEFHSDIEYFYEVVSEITETEQNKYSTKAYINVYEIKAKDWSKPITRANLKLKKVVKLKEVRK